MAISALAVTAALTTLGFYTDLRHVMHGALVAIGLVALLPFVLISAVCALLFAVGIVLALLSGGEGGELVYAGAEGTTAMGARFVRGYYALLSRLRHPVLLGVALGTVLGSVCCWGLLAVLVIPRETASIQALLRAQVHVEKARIEQGRYPSPNDLGQILLLGEPAVDAFGRPIHYQVHGVWKAQTYRLSSLGADGVKSVDDLCLGGRTRLVAMAERVLAPLEALVLLQGKKASWNERLSLLQAAGCAAGGER